MEKYVEGLPKARLNRLSVYPPSPRGEAVVSGKIFAVRQYIGDFFELRYAHYLIIPGCLLMLSVGRVLRAIQYFRGIKLLVRKPHPTARFSAPL